MKTCALAAGLRGDLAEGERRLAFGGHSLRAGLASSAQIEEAHVQKHLGHASAEMTRRYQRKRDRFTDQPHKGGGAIESATQRLSASRSRNSPRPGARSTGKPSMARALVRKAQLPLIPAVA